MEYDKQRDREKFNEKFQIKNMIGLTDINPMLEELLTEYK